MAQERPTQEESSKPSFPTSFETSVKTLLDFLGGSGAIDSLYLIIKPSGSRVVVEVIKDNRTLTEQEKNILNFAHTMVSMATGGRIDFQNMEQNEMDTMKKLWQDRGTKFVEVRLDLGKQADTFKEFFNLK